jgi:hypothetical protein
MIQESRRDLRSLAVELSQVLAELHPAGGWRVKEGAEMDRVTLEAANGAAFTLWGSAGNHRLEITGRFPMDGQRFMSARDWGVIRYNDKAPEITVSRARDARVMARDIFTRFLSRYLPLYEQAEAVRASRADWRTRRDATAARLGEILGVEPRKFQGEPDATPRLHADGLDFEVNGDNSVKVELRCTGDFAEKLARWYQENV